MGLYELIDYLVRLKLADHRKALCALYLLSLGESRSSAAERCGSFKGEVNGYLNRLKEKYHDGQRALVIVKYVIPLLDEIQPVVKDNKCLICGRNLYHIQVAMTHLYTKHKDLVESYVNKIIEKLKLLVQS